MKYKGKFIGKIMNVFKLDGRKQMVQIETSDIDLSDITPDIEMVFDFKKFNASKTLSQNGYYWALVRKISEHRDIRRSEAYVHNELLRGFGQPVLIEDERVPVRINVNRSRSVDENTENHFKPTDELTVGEDNEIYRTYYLLRGSRSYDVKEMGTLIDGAVGWAKDLDIEVESPEELARMKEQWGL